MISGQKGGGSRFCLFNKLALLCQLKAKHIRAILDFSVSYIFWFTAILPKIYPEYNHVSAPIPLSSYLKIFAITIEVDFIIIFTFHYLFLWDLLILGMLICWFYPVKYVWKRHVLLLHSLQEPLCGSAISLSSLLHTQRYHRLELFSPYGLQTISVRATANVKPKREINLCGSKSLRFWSFLLVQQNLAKADWSSLLTAFLDLMFASYIIYHSQSDCS